MPAWNKSNHDDASEIRETHLDWSNKQRRILTGGDRAEGWYTAERGYPFHQQELPHYRLLRGDTRNAFQQWKQDQAAVAGSKRDREGGAFSLSPLVGAWTRLFFFGGWEHTTGGDERTYNLQTRNLFIDLRIPRTRSAVLAVDRRSLQELTKDELRCYARQHVFAGYTQIQRTNQDDLLCTRHHCIDWNFVGHGRSRPNKWYAEMQKAGGQVQTWKEWAFAKDHRGHHYYCEQWERLPRGQGYPMLALRRQNQDGILLVVGDHFNYVLARDLSCVTHETQTKYAHYSSLGGLVDAALDQNDLATARSYLSIQGGHGLVSKGWWIDCAIEPWREGTPLWSHNDRISVQGDRIHDCKVVWNDDVWEVFDTTFTTKDEIIALLNRQESKL